MIIAIVLVLIVVGSVLFHMLSPWWWTPIASNWGYIDTTLVITFWITGIVFIMVILFLANGFLKFVWSHRLFGYCAVVMAAVPEGDAKNPETAKMARKAAKLNIYAARSFNRGIRTMYFALAGLAWLLGPVALILTTGATVLMLYRREFHSQSRLALLED